MPLRSNPHGPYSPTTAGAGADCSARPMTCGPAIRIMTPATALDILPMPAFFRCVCVGTRVGMSADHTELLLARLRDLMETAGHRFHPENTPSFGTATPRAICLALHLVQYAGQLKAEVAVLARIAVVSAGLASLVLGATQSGSARAQA